VVGRYVLGKFPREELEFLNDEVFPKAWQLILDELKKNLNKK
jgi:peptidyl-tRNA hydrolase